LLALAVSVNMTSLKSLAVLVLGTFALGCSPLRNEIIPSQEIYSVSETSSEQPNIPNYSPDLRNFISNVDTSTAISFDIDFKHFGLRINDSTYYYSVPVNFLTCEKEIREYTEICFGIPFSTTNPDIDSEYKQYDIDYFLLYMGQNHNMYLLFDPRTKEPKHLIFDDRDLDSISAYIKDYIGDE